MVRSGFIGERMRHIVAPERILNPAFQWSFHKKSLVPSICPVQGTKSYDSDGFGMTCHLASLILGYTCEVSL
jgi:hypothetical protein